VPYIPPQTQIRCLAIIMATGSCVAPNPSASSVGSLPPDALNLTVAADLFRVRDLFFIQDNANTIANILNASNVLYYEASLTAANSSRSLDTVRGIAAIILECACHLVSCANS
jgi:hypothetical protein